MGPAHGGHHRVPLTSRAAGSTLAYPALMLVRVLAAVASLLATLSLAGTASGTRPGDAGLTATLGSALAEPGISPRRTGALVVDLRTGATVFQHNADRALAPASAEKLAVSFAALRVLGPAYRFHTQIVGDGSRSGRVWNGNVYLVGGGDPTLTRADLDVLARRVRASGIRRVTGSVLGDETRFDTQRAAPGWKDGFLGFESPPVSGLVVVDADRHGPNGSAAAAARALAVALERAGVAVGGMPSTGRVPAGGVVLTSLRSEPLAAIARRMNRDSDNFVAEMMLKELGTMIAARGSFAAGAEVTRRALVDAGVPVAGVRIVDGSGLSRLDRLTARALVAILRAGVADPAIRQPFVDSLAVAGVSGTMKRRLAMKSTKGRVRAKTGTTSQACTLAGFVGRRYAFAILQTGSPVPYGRARAAQDRFVTALARS